MNTGVSQIKGLRGVVITLLNDKALETRAALAVCPPSVFYLSQMAQIGPGSSPREAESSTAVVLNWWVVTQNWVADPFSVGRGPLGGEGNA